MVFDICRVFLQRIIEIRGFNIVFTWHYVDISPWQDVWNEVLNRFEHQVEGDAQENNATQSKRVYDGR